MNGSARPASEETPGATSAAAGARPKRKRQAVLVTGDDALWPLVGAAIPGDVVLSQIDSIEQLVGTTESGHAGAVIWDARGDAEHAEHLVQLQRHSARLAVMVLDLPEMSVHWQRLAQKNHLVASAPLPFAQAAFKAALEATLDEAQVRVTLLGAATQPAADDARQPAAAPGAAHADRAPPRRSVWPLALGALLALAACAVAVWLYATRATVGPKDAADAAPPALQPAAPPADAGPAAGSAQADALLSKARLAMSERRYIDPADNSALGYFREVLARDPGNDEAKQGLARLEELLLSRAETALDQRRFDPALQALEAARSINKDDARIPALDARVSQMRAEIGAASIQAAINAGNYERATSQIDEAARAKALGADQLAALRESLRQHQEADADRAAKAAARAQADRAAQEAKSQAAREQEQRAQRQHLTDLLRERLAQNKLSDPAQDSAAYYLEQLRSADPQNPQLAEFTRELKQKVDAGRATPSAAAAAGSAANAAAQLPLRLVKPIRPAYPAGALRAGTEGWVDLEYQVGPDGRPSAIRVVDADPAGAFDRAAVAALQAARYEPLPKSAPQVARPAKQRVTFKLSN